MGSFLHYEDVIITSLIKYGESDCIVRLLCKERGRISAFVKNGLKPSKTRGSILQAPVMARVGLVIYDRDRLAKLSHIEVSPTTFLLSRKLRSYGLFCYLAELVELFVAENDFHVGLYELLADAFVFLAEKETDASLLRGFELKLLNMCGYLPDLHCAVGFSDKPIVGYDPDNGHFLTSHRPGLLVFNEEAKQVAIELLRNPLSASSSYDEKILRVVSRIFYGRLKRHAKSMRSIKFLQAIGA